MHKTYNFSVNNIIAIEGTNADNCVMIKTNQKKEEYSLVFCNIFEKYIFKTVLFYRLVIIPNLGTENE